MKIIGNMDLTKKQTEEELSKYLSKENGLNEVLEMMLNAMMLSERSELRPLHKYSHNRFLVFNSKILDDFFEKRSNLDHFS